MFRHSLRAAVASTAAALLLAAPFVSAQDHDSDLKITRRSTDDRTNDRVTPTAQLDRSRAFRRLSPVTASVSDLEANRPHRHRIETLDRSELARARQPASAWTVQSFGTGGGDLFEIEPNDSVAQAVSLPVNLFGEISVNRDVDYFAFRVLPNQQVTVEAFAARLTNSILIPDLALFDSSRGERSVMGSVA